MTRQVWIAWGLLAGLCVWGGCGEPTARVRGQLYEGDGRKFTLQDGEQGAIMFFALSSDGQLDPLHVYSALLMPDGAFEVQVSDGRIPVGKYRIALDLGFTGPPDGKKHRRGDRLAGRFSRDQSPLTVELKSGDNNLSIDLASGSVK